MIRAIPLRIAAVPSKHMLSITTVPAKIQKLEKINSRYSILISELAGPGG